MPEIVLDFGGAAVQLAVKETATVRSGHTGRTLARITGECRVVGHEQHQGFADLIDGRANGTVQSVAPGIEPDRMWRVRLAQHSYTTPSSGPTTFTETLEMEEYESHEPTRLVIAGLALQPYEYKEEVSAKGLIDLSVKVQVNDEDERALRERVYAGEEYLDVVRDGLSDQSRRMRFTQTVWSKHGAGNKYHFGLAEEEPDNLTRPVLFPQLPRLVVTVAVHQGVIDGLQSLLVAKNIATQDEVDQIVAAARESRIERLHKFFEVADVDMIAI